MQKELPNGMYDGRAEVVITVPGGAPTNETVAVWKGIGVGRSDGQGGIKWVGGITVHSKSERLDGIAAYGHFTVSSDGDVVQRFYRVN
ncbi:hypothetical protein ACFQ3Z_39420 [Streptomyces nogalater]